MEQRKYGPKQEDDAGIGLECQACKKPLAVGDYTTLVVLGPGDRPEARQAAREGRAYNAIAIEIHWACATGEE